MTWTAWNNCKHHSSGAGYGFKVSMEDRDLYFKRTWKTVSIYLPASSGESTVEVNVSKRSFWSPACGELISAGIGRWLISREHARWDVGSPPKFEVAVVADRCFRIQA